jgi:small subunit ribosomal protein S15e
MADIDAEVGTVQPKKRTFKKFTFRGVDLDALLDMSSDELVELFHARARRRFQRGLKRKPMALIKKLRKAKREAPTGEKPEPVRTHLRNMIIVPEMIGSVIGVYNGKTFNQVEIKVCLSRSLWDDRYFQFFSKTFGCKTERNLYRQHGHCHPKGATGF